MRVLIRLLYCPRDLLSTLTSVGVTLGPIIVYNTASLPTSIGCDPYSWSHGCLRCVEATDVTVGNILRLWPGGIPVVPATSNVLSQEIAMTEGG